MSWRRETSSPAETEALAAELAAGLAAGDVVLVEGELGAGKTTFVRGACRALGVDGVVTSPTFTIGQRYPAAVPISHLDLYRVADLREEDPDLLDEYLGADRIAFVEWPEGAVDTIAGLSRVAARVVIEHGGGGRRVITVEGATERGQGPDGVPGLAAPARSASVPRSTGRPRGRPEDAVRKRSPKPVIDAA